METPQLNPKSNTELFKYVQVFIKTTKHKQVLGIRNSTLATQSIHEYVCECFVCV